MIEFIRSSGPLAGYDMYLFGELVSHGATHAEAQGKLIQTTLLRVRAILAAGLTLPNITYEDPADVAQNDRSRFSVAR